MKMVYAHRVIFTTWKHDTKMINYKHTKTSRAFIRKIRGTVLYKYLGYYVLIGRLRLGAQ
jgi:hypothetical protein